jgi:hypothetical protein
MEGPWTKWGVVIALLALILTYVGTAAGLHWPPFSQSAAPRPATGQLSNVTAKQASATPSSQGGGVPPNDLGSWGGTVRQVNGLTERFIMNLQQGTPGSRVGTFSNQTANCQGDIVLNGQTTVTLNGTGVPAADLNLETTQNSNGACVSSVEAYVASADGTTLVYEVITAGTTQGSLQDPLAVADLTH